MRRVVFLLATAVAVASLPALGASAAPASLVTASPYWQGSNGKRDISVTVAVANGASSTCELFDEDELLETWQPCLPVYTFAVDDLADGDYRLAARARLGAEREYDTSNFTVDRRAPEVRISSNSGPSVLRDFWATWRVSGKETHPVDFEVQQRVDSPFNGLGDWKARATPRNARSLEFDLDRGETLCVRVRASDIVGQTGEWSRELCRTRYLDDRDLDGWRGSAEWESIPFSGNAFGTALVSKSRGATLSLRVKRLSELTIWGRKGPYGGEIEIRIGGTLIDRVSLKSAQPKRVRLFSGEFRNAQSGRLTIEVTSADGKYIHLDALELHR